MKKPVLLILYIFLSIHSQSQNQNISLFLEHNNLTEYENLIIIGLNPGNRKQDAGFISNVISLTDSFNFFKVIVLFTHVRQSEMDSIFQILYQIPTPRCASFISDSLFNSFSGIGESFVAVINQKRKVFTSTLMYAYEFLNRFLEMDRANEPPFKITRIKETTFNHTSLFSYIEKADDQFLIIDPAKDEIIELSEDLQLIRKHKIEYHYDKVFHTLINNEFKVTSSKFLEYKKRINPPERYIIYSSFSNTECVDLLCQYSYGIREENRFPEIIPDDDSVFGIYSYDILAELKDSIRYYCLPKYGFPEPMNGSYGVKALLFNSKDSFYYFSLSNFFHSQTTSDSLYLIGIFSKKDDQLNFESFLEYKIPLSYSYTEYYSKFNPIIFNFNDSIFLYDNVSESFGLINGSNVWDCDQLDFITSSEVGQIKKLSTSNDTIFFLSQNKEDYSFFRFSISAPQSMDKIAIPEYFTTKTKFLLDNKRLLAFRFDDFYIDIAEFEFE